MEKDNINTKDYWEANYSGGFYQDKLFKDKDESHKLIDQALKGVPTNKIVLEVACGLAHNSFHIAEKGFKVLATDLTKVAIEESKKRYSHENITYMTATIDDLTQMFSGSFHVIFAFEILEHFKNPIPIIRKLRKLLSPDGMLIFSTPHILGKYAYWREHYSYWNYETAFERMITSGFTEVNFIHSTILHKQQIFGVAR